MQGSRTSVVEPAGSMARHRRRCRAFATQAAIPTVLGQVWTVDEGAKRSRLGAAPLSQCLHSCNDPNPISDREHTHLLESHLIQLQKNVSSDIIGSENRRMVGTLDTGEPCGNMAIGPSS